MAMRLPIAAITTFEIRLRRARAHLVEALRAARDLDAVSP